MDLKIDLNLSGTYVMNDSDNRKQFFYASQCYGTLFAIYIKINVKKNNEIENIDFELINYKGMVNLGFLEDSTHNRGINVVREKDTLVINFPIKAMTKQYKATFTPKKEEAINVSGLTVIAGERSLLRYDEYTPSNYQENVFFDEEFYYRNGKDKGEFSVKPARRGQQGHSENKIIAMNCVETVLKVI